ncbi:Protein cubitus interruptus [Gryllus bimaculatus]|nr:Protein cubitus interruptus [Gryllus bimaculatus]
MLFIEQQLRGSGFSHGIVESSEIAPPQQQLRQLSSEVATGRNVEQHQPVLPAILVPKSEQMDDAYNEKSMDEYVLGYDTNETDERARSPRGEQNLNQSSSAVGRPQTQATTRRGGQRGRRPPERSASAAASGPDGTPSGRSSRKLYFTCGECPASFSSHQCLVLHKRAHTGGRLFRCDVCHIAFTKLSTLVTHRAIHTGERAYRCDVCGKAFNRSNILSRHKRAHTGERPYSCHVCGMAFSQSGSLARHLITAHNVTPRGRQPAGQVNSSTGADAQGGGRNS